MKKSIIKKEPSLLRKLIEAHVERYKAHKAMRLLTKQEWSVEFLTALLVRASRISKEQLQLTITNGNQRIEILTPDPNTINKALGDDNIFNHLDDEIRVRNYLETLNKG